MRQTIVEFEPFVTLAISGLFTAYDFISHVTNLLVAQIVLVVAAAGTVGFGYYHVVLPIAWICGWVFVAARFLILTLWRLLRFVPMRGNDRPHLQKRPDPTYDIGVRSPQLLSSLDTIRIRNAEEEQRAAIIGSHATINALLRRLEELEHPSHSSQGPSRLEETAEAPPFKEGTWGRS